LHLCSFNKLKKKQPQETKNMRSAAILIALLALFAIFAQGAELTQKKPVVFSKTMVPKEHLTERVCLFVS